MSIAPRLRRHLFLWLLAALAIVQPQLAFADCAAIDPLCWAGRIPAVFGGAARFKDDAPAHPSNAPIAPTAAPASDTASAPILRSVPPSSEQATAAPSIAPAYCKATKATNSAPFSISVDGQPIGDKGKKNSADSQRCTDQALQRANVQVRYDGLINEPALNVIANRRLATRGGSVIFKTYSNYALFLRRGEIRVFDKRSTSLADPIAILPLDGDAATWKVPPQTGAEVAYVFRAYDAQGRFDETSPKSLSISDAASARAEPPDHIDPGLLRDNNIRKLANIPVVGGTISVSGKHVPHGDSVVVMGLPVPVDAQGSFAFRQIVSTGAHEVSVAIIDQRGVANVFSRSANVPDHDFFYVGLAEFTAGANGNQGPVSLLAPDQADDYKTRYYDGRVAFYLKGKILGDTLITMAADTRDEPFHDLFTNFSSKDPGYLLRNLDPNRYYPVYGDDSALVEDAPTRGKFYVRIDKGDNNIMWGNFKTTITGTEYVRYDRGLYGARVQAKTADSTIYGERRGQLEVFAAQPGTVGVRDVFRGTGGSVYLLSRQNITEGSESLTIELRDPVSGLVIASKALSVNQDYTISYLQGGITLSDPLLATGAADFIIQGGTSGGGIQYLVANYEYSPGLQPTTDNTFGGRASYWINDHVQVGASGYDQTSPGEKLLIGGADITLRATPKTYLKIEGARSSGPGSGENDSFDGGFTFTTLATNGKPAFARRVEAAADLADLLPGAQGRLAAYWKLKDADFAGPGELALGSVSAEEMGLRGEFKFNEHWEDKAKVDLNNDQYSNYIVGEEDLSYIFNPNWRATVGLRIDDNKVLLPSASPDLNEAGKRVDLALRFDFNKGDNWGAYVFGQATVMRTQQREANNRVGVGGYKKINAALTASAEVSEGNLGLGGKVGLEYKQDANRTYYINYAYDPDRTDILERGGLGLLTAGANQRYADNLSVFGEEHARYGGGFSGMTHAYGLDFAPVPAWKTGVKFETGTLTDPIAGTTQRTSVSPSVGYSTDRFSFSSRFEYRHDDVQALAAPLGAPLGALPELTRSVTDTYLINNLLSAKISQDWRFIAHVNGSYSTASQNNFYQGNYLEVSNGFAYRPINNDRLNLLFKYAYFYNVPADGQQILAGSINEYSQQSHVLSIDGIYDLNKWFSVGGKIAFRIGELKDNLLGGPWYNSAATLLIGRVDFHLIKQWDASAELRTLAVSNPKTRQTGGLLAIYRHINDNFKIGAGYNFTSYSDDLTNLSTNNRGVFVNAVGMF